VSDSDGKVPDTIPTIPLPVPCSQKVTVTFFQSVVFAKEYETIRASCGHSFDRAFPRAFAQTSLPFVLTNKRVRKMIVPMNNALRNEHDQYTYADILSWDDDECRRELIDGVVYEMAQPTIAHQIISAELIRNLGNYLVGKTCRLIQAPDVRLFPKPEWDDDTVVAPDIVVVCDRSKIKKQSCIGAPDLVIEILSPSTSWKDRGDKFKLYKKAGVREYWIVDPRHETVQVYLRESDYEPCLYRESVPVGILSGCVIDMPAIWEAADIEDDGEKLPTSGELAAQYGLSVDEVCRWASKNHVSYLMHEGQVFYVWSEETIARLYNDIGWRVK
jgi:Uma2 family endonuclease